MKFFESSFSHHHKSTPVVATNMSIDPWSRQLPIESTQLVRKIEMCTAGASGEDAWGTPVGETHLHTLLRVSLVPDLNGPGPPGKVFLIERVLATGGAHHSVTPISQVLFDDGGTLFHPEVHDRVCIVSDGPSSALARHLEVERTLTFGDGASEPRLTLAELGQVLAFVGRTTKLTCAGGDCKFQSRSFSFTCMAALTTSLPPRTSGRRLGERVDMNVKDGTVVVDDSGFELAAVTFLGQIPWLFGDPESVQTLGLIESLRTQPRATAAARLYH